MTAKFVIGCDGANSTVRQFISADMEDLGFKERWLVVDVLLKQEMPELGDYTVQYCSPSQAMTYCRNPGLRRRWELALPEEVSDDEASQSTRIWAMLSRWINPDNADLERTAVYTFKSEIADQWRKGRVFIAGDAAHLTPPFMGQGMCAGIRDATNLAWKLALCEKGEINENVLDSYQQERQPHVREYIETAIALGELIGSMDADKVASMSGKQAESPSASNKKIASPEPKLGAATCFSHSLMRTKHAGRLFSQPQLFDGSLLDDHCGYRYVLIANASVDMDEEAVPQNGPLLVHAEKHPLLAAELAQLGVMAVLVRPDRYIAATADNGSDAILLLRLISNRTIGTF